MATLTRDRIKSGQILLHAIENGAPIWLSLYPDVRKALDCLPLPQGAAPDCPYFFWTSTEAREGHIKTVDRTLQAVLAKSGAPGAHAHRFRHTLASEVPGNGGTIVDAANILGNGPAIIRKHNLKRSREY